MTAARGQDQRQQLDEIEQQIKEKQQEVETISGQERDLLKELRSIDKQLKAAQQELEEYRRQLAGTEAELQATQARIATLKAEHAETSGLLARRLRAIYKMGDLGYFSALLSLSSQAETQQQLVYLQHLAAHDKALLKASETHIQAILQEQATLEQQKRDILDARNAIEEQSSEILAQQKHKTALLASIQTDKEQHRQLLEDLQRSADRLDGMIETIDSTMPEAVAPQSTPAPGEDVTIPVDAAHVAQTYKRDFRSNKGHLLWPVQGQIFTKFGRIQIGDTYTNYKGVDIRAETGTPFYAVFKGTVKFADWFDGYGNLVILDHGGEYFTLYAHASELLVQSGDVVASRQMLGKVGDTDSIKGPHLYFEIRANGKPQNPQTWLTKLR